MNHLLVWYFHLKNFNFESSRYSSSIYKAVIDGIQNKFKSNEGVSFIVCLELLENIAFSELIGDQNKIFTKNYQYIFFNKPLLLEKNVDQKE